MEKNVTYRYYVHMLSQAMGVLVVVLIMAGEIRAHGVRAGLVHERTVCVNFAYDDGEPMSYAKVVVTAPELEHPFQTGATDAQGTICFLPDRAGNWSVTVNDGLGHSLRFDAQVAQDNVPASPAIQPSGFGRWSGAVFGVGILLALAGSVSMWRFRRKQL